MDPNDQESGTAGSTTLHAITENNVSKERCELLDKIIALHIIPLEV